MKYLLDTHTLIWAQDSPARLGNAARQALQNPVSILILSHAIIW